MNLAATLGASNNAVEGFANQRTGTLPVAERGGFEPPIPVKV